MRGPIPGRRRLHDAEFEWRPRTWTQALQASRADDEGRCGRGHRSSSGSLARRDALPAVCSSPAPCVARPRLPWPWSPSSITTVGGFHTKLPDRAPVPQDVGPRRPDLVHDRPMARSRRSMERDVESRSWRSSSVAGAHSSATRTATESAAEQRGAGTARSPRDRERDAARRCARTYGWGEAGKRGEVARQGGTPRGSRRLK